MSFSSKTVALVTGGASGLGAAAVRALRQQGARVMIADLQEPSTFKDASSPDLQFSRVDVTDADSVTQALNAVESAFGQPVNACIQCAGVATARKMISAKGVVHALEDFEKTLQINTVGTFNVARLAVERMQANDLAADGQRGCLIHTASIAAYEGQVGQVAYAASKGAIVGMTLPMARDLAPLGIRVMTIVRVELCNKIERHEQDGRLWETMVLFGEGKLSHTPLVCCPCVFALLFLCIYRRQVCSRHPCWKVCPNRYKTNSGPLCPILADWETRTNLVN